jgi:alpha-beta hydrolase superfamily lysophospholipase
MHGTADRLASLPASQEFAAQAPAASMFQVWPDNYHELHNDLDREAVLENVVAWIDGNL